jgi:hypothetical protein
VNERIKELAKQAGLTQAKDFKSGDEVKNFVFGNGLEKFAELIVRECASMARVFQSNEYDFTGDLDLDQFMLKHFGVEE